MENHTTNTKQFDENNKDKKEGEHYQKNSDEKPSLRQAQEKNLEINCKLKLDDYQQETLQKIESQFLSLINNNDNNNSPSLLEKKEEKKSGQTQQEKANNSNNYNYNNQSNNNDDDQGEQLLLSSDSEVYSERFEKQKNLIQKQDQQSEKNEFSVNLYLKQNTIKECVLDTLKKDQLQKNQREQVKIDSRTVSLELKQKNSITSNSFKGNLNSKSKKWGQDDTNSFYQLYQLFGTDFSMMQKYLQPKTITQIQERQNPQKFQNILQENFNEDILQRLVGDKSKGSIDSDELENELKEYLTNPNRKRLKKDDKDTKSPSSDN